MVEPLGDLLNGSPKKYQLRLSREHYMYQVEHYHFMDKMQDQLDQKH